MAGRPRKLREDSIVQSENGNVQVLPQSSEKIESKFKPYHGSDSLLPNEPRFFVNGRKVLRVIKKQRGLDDNKNPVYRVDRMLFRTIYDKTPQGKKLREQLKRCGIPGA